jgi:anti-sigma factor RsiW
MNCRQCAELLLEFLAGELDAGICEHIRQHLARCPPCEVYVQTYQITVHLTRQLPCAELPAEFAERLWRTLKECEPET